MTGAGDGAFGGAGCPGGVLGAGDGPAPGAGGAGTVAAPGVGIGVRETGCGAGPAACVAECFAAVDAAACVTAVRAGWKTTFFA